MVDIPKVNKMLACFHNSKFFTSLDLRSRYYHINLSPEMRHESVFTTILGKYEFLRMLFGVGQGPVYFTALMQKVFSQLKDFSFFPFFHMDDELVHDTSKTDHLDHLKLIF